MPDDQLSQDTPQVSPTGDPVNNFASEEPVVDPVATTPSAMPSDAALPTDDKPVATQPDLVPPQIINHTDPLATQAPMSQSPPVVSSNAEAESVNPVPQAAPVTTQSDSFAPVKTDDQEGDMPTKLNEAGGVPVSLNSDTVEPPAAVSSEPSVTSGSTQQANVVVSESGPVANGATPEQQTPAAGSNKFNKLKFWH